MKSRRVFVIAEVAQNHEGSLGLAHAFVDAVASTVANAIKFQTHIAEAESTPSEPFRVPFSLQDESRFAYWKRMEFTKDQWLGLKEHAEEKGLTFLSSPFSVEAVDLLQGIGVEAWKIGSGETASTQMLDRILATRKPVYVSTGMSSFEEIDRLVGSLKASSAHFTLMQCTTSYPNPAESVGLNVMQEFQRRYQCDVGLSDHSGTIYPGLAAAVLGASAIEVHVTLSREMFGPDVSSSITTRELRELVEGIRFIERMLDHPVDKDRIAKELQPLRTLFGKSAVAIRDLPAGTVVQAADIAFKKPGLGICEPDAHQLIGKKTLRSIPRNTVFVLEDLQ